MNQTKNIKMRVIFSAINFRMVLIFVETLVVYFFYDRFNFSLQIDFTILSIAIVFRWFFPLPVPIKNVKNRSGSSIVSEIK